MSDQPVAVHGGDYEHVLGISGEYAGGVRLDYRAMGLQGLFARMLAERCFEVCEFSLANYLMLRAAGADWLRALPIFPNRAFRHGHALTRVESPLTGLEQLAGRRVGVPDYSMTAAVWLRGLLADEYGVPEGAVTWVTGPRQRLPFPSQARVEVVDEDLEDALTAGRIDALLGFSPRDARLPSAQRRLRPVLADAEAAERDYYTRARIFPIMHCVVIRSDVLQAMPGLAPALWEAYTAAKADAYRRRLGTTLAPWSARHWERVFALFGGDPLPYGLTSENRRVVERLGAYIVQQGFVGAVPPLEDIFLPVD
jgi:4,5-dihydroxyphthalate decarboxylase